MAELSPADRLILFIEGYFLGFGLTVDGVDLSRASVDEIAASVRLLQELTMTSAGQIAPPDQTVH